MSSALEFCQVVEGELVSTSVKFVGDQVEWSYSCSSGTGTGTTLGNPTEGYSRALEAAKLRIESTPPEVKGPLVWTRDGQVLALSEGGGRSIAARVVASFPTVAEAAKYVNEWRARNGV